MTFDEQLKQHIATLNCTAKKVASASNITQATLSRYCNGIRVPSSDSAEINSLAGGISLLAKKAVQTKSGSEDAALQKLTSYSFVRETLIATLNEEPDTDQVIKNFNILVDSLDIKISKMARHVGYDASYLSRIRAGQRKPADVNNFINNICSFVVSTYNSPEELNRLSQILNCDISALSESPAFFSEMRHWLSSHSSDAAPASSINRFLDNLDSFDLDEYIRSIHFDELKVPNIPLYIIRPKTYYGVEEMKEAELDFFRGTVLSKSMEPILMFSDMPMEDMAQDLEFGKKWMFAIAMAIKKGLHLNVIHNLNRPFNELLLGLQSWIPLYMTGQISPYYFKGKPSSIFRQLTYVSGTCALDGQCVIPNHDHGKYTLYSAKSDMIFYRQKACDLLSKAHSLMDIYHDTDIELLQDFYNEEAAKPGTFKNKLSVPPLYSISYGLLERILTRTGHMEQIDAFWHEAIRQRNTIKELLSRSPLYEEVAFLSREEFDRFPASLPYPNRGEEIRYSYEEYLEHVELTESFCRENNNYKLKKEEKAPFRNIQIRMKEDAWVIISKKKSPAIHFVIYHPQLLHAIWNFIPLAEE